MQDELLTAEEVAQILKVNKQTVYKKKNEIGYVEIFGGRLRFERSKVLEWLEKQTVKPVET
jgi:excisionase family DNA binding protein